MSSKGRIVALDPATVCGFAVYDQFTEQLVSGIWKLAPRRHESAGMRFIKLTSSLREIDGVDVVYYEEVRRHLGTSAAHIYGGLVASIQTHCIGHEPKIEYCGVPVATIKKHATGKGNASKELMLSTARENWPDENVVDDNQADALWLLHYALNTYHAP